MAVLWSSVEIAEAAALDVAVNVLAAAVGMATACDTWAALATVLEAETAVVQWVADLHNNNEEVCDLAAATACYALLLLGR